MKRVMLCWDSRGCWGRSRDVMTNDEESVMKSVKSMMKRRDE